jgi:hypothetical protein
MRIMLDLLIRFLELRACCERVKNHPQLTNHEKAAAFRMKVLVRECLPKVVLATYDRLERREPELLESPEVFAMAVLAETYRQESAAGRRKLDSHFSVTRPVSRARTRRSVLPRRGLGKKTPQREHQTLAFSN